MVSLYWFMVPFPPRDAGASLKDEHAADVGRPFFGISPA